MELSSATFTQNDLDEDLGIPPTQLDPGPFGFSFDRRGNLLVALFAGVPAEGDRAPADLIPAGDPEFPAGARSELSREGDAAMDERRALEALVEI